jgi:hypothetical protein
VVHHFRDWIAVGRGVVLCGFFCVVARYGQGENDMQRWLLGG